MVVASNTYLIVTYFGFGFGKTERTCVRIENAEVLITVIVPTYDNSLWIHEFNTDLTFLQGSNSTTLNI
jgi:hypothetical protein